MANLPRTVRPETRKFQRRNEGTDRKTPRSILRLGQTRSRVKSFPVKARKNPAFRAHRVGFDRTAGSEHNYMYVNPVEGRQARRKTPGCTDGAKIYICYRRSCFLTGKRRSGLLNRLSPRKSRLPSHPSKMR